MVEKAQKTILVTGATGRLGRALAGRLNTRYKLIPISHKKCDIADEKRIRKCLLRFRPWLVIHTAAITNVDQCELFPEEAHCCNVKGTYNIAQAAKALGSMVMYLSSDYVFSGRKKTPYREEDIPHPVNVYGKTKLEGEKIVKKLVKKHIIIRTSWLFGKGKANFVDTILKRSKNSRSLKIVADKFSSPTYAGDLAQAIERIVDSLDSDSWPDTRYGVYHITNAGFCSWYEYAKFILKSAGLASIRIEPLPMSEMNFSARRPIFSVLDNAKYRRIFKFKLRPWQEAVKEYIACTYN